MTNALGIAAVTAVLIDQLNNGALDAAGAGDVRVTAQSPEAIRIGGGQPSNRLNLFLYRVERNQGWANECLPERSSRGERTARGLLPLDLHYLLSAYGNSDIEAEILLGYGMQLLAELPVLDRDAIRRSLGGGAVAAANLPPAYAALSAADLADQVEQVRISHHQLTMEEEWRLWAALHTGLRPSATYKASAVLIESPVPGRSALPVRQARIQVDQIRRPRIDRVRSALAAAGPRRDDAVIRRGHFLVLEGSGLRGLETVVRLGSTDVVAPPAQVGDREVVVQIPPATRPGLVSVQVAHRIPRPLPLGTPPLTPAPSGEVAPMTGELSNAVVAPIAVGLPAGALVLANPSFTAARASADLTATYDQPIGARQRVSVSLNELDPPAGRPAHAFTVDATAAAAGVETVASSTFPIRGVPRAEYLVRVTVDGVDSELVVSGGRYTQPSIDLSGP